MTDATPRLSRQQALRLVEGAYLAAATGLIWLALYYLPVGGAIFRLALPPAATLATHLFSLGTPPRSNE